MARCILGTEGNCGQPHLLTAQEVQTARRGWPPPHVCLDWRLFARPLPTPPRLPVYPLHPFCSASSLPLSPPSLSLSPPPSQAVSSLCQSPPILPSQPVEVPPPSGSLGLPPALSQGVSLCHPPPSLPLTHVLSAAPLLMGRGRVWWGWSREHRLEESSAVSSCPMRQEGRSGQPFSSCSPLQPCRAIPQT